MAKSLLNDQGHDIWYQSSSDPRDLNKKVMESDSSYQRTMIVTVYYARYPITKDVLHQVFDPYGKIEMIQILPETKYFKALLRFQHHNSVKSAKACLHSRNIYDGCCRLDIQFLATSFWDYELSKENIVKSFPSDVYELMNEMSSTIENLISKLDEFRNPTAENKIRQAEPQVFDKLSAKQFMEFSAAKVDSNKFQSTLMKETVAEHTEFPNKDEKETSAVEGESDDENAERSSAALDKVEKASEEFFLSQGLKNIDMEQKKEGGNDERAVELKKLHDSSIPTAAELGASFASALVGLAPNDIIQRTSGRLDGLQSKGTSHFTYISATNLIRVFFDPGGYIIIKWKVSLPLNFGCVMVGVSDLHLNFLGVDVVCDSIVKDTFDESLECLKICGYMELAVEVLVLEKQTKVMENCSHFDSSLFDVACGECSYGIKIALDDNYIDKATYVVSLGFYVMVGKKNGSSDDVEKCLYEQPDNYIRLNYFVVETSLAVILALIDLAVLLVLIKYATKNQKQVKKSAQSKRMVDTPGLCRFSKVEMENSINCGNEKKCLVRGDRGLAYKGMFPNGQLIAMKKTHKSNTLNSFGQEISGLSRVGHPNFVRLFGCCIEDGQQYLVNEYCTRGNLAQHLLWKDIVLSLEMRVNILRACANILLTHDMQPKLSDFGLAKMLRMEIKSKMFVDVRGAIGYMDLKCMRNSNLTSASDIYSFGFVTLQILCGQRVMDLDLDAGDQSTRKAKVVNMTNRPLTEFQDLMMKGEFECPVTFGYGPRSPSCKEKFQAMVELFLNFHPNGALYEQKLLVEAFCLLRLYAMELGGKLDPRGRGLFDPGGNVMTSFGSGNLEEKEVRKGWAVKKKGTKCEREKHIFTLSFY